MKQKPDTVIIMINWNSGTTTRDCIESVLKSTDKSFQIIVVDNGSKDGSLELLENKFHSVHFIKNRGNEGFCKANNVAMKYALSMDFENIILLNNDMIVHRDWLKNLKRNLKKLPDAGIAGGKILFKDLKPAIINSTGVSMNLLGYCYDRDFGKFEKEVKRKTGKVFAISGGFMLIKKSTIEQIGYLDPEYFAYFEDVEYCARLRRMTGKEVYYIDDSITYHEFSGSSKKKPILRFYLSIKNYWLNISKTFSPGMLRKNFIRIVYDRLKNGILLQLKRKNYAFFAIEILYISIFPFFFLKNLHRSVRKNFADKYYPYMDHSTALPITLENLEKTMKKKWDKS